ncbi:unnamed protein product, partial [marine sediment metagenome]
MSISVPYGLVAGLIGVLHNYTEMSLQQASSAGKYIEDIAIAAAESALSQGKTYSDIVESHIYTNMDTNLHLVMDYADRQVDVVKDGLTDAILLLQAQIDGLGG